MNILIFTEHNHAGAQMLAGWISYYTKKVANVYAAGVNKAELDLIGAKAMMEAVIDITKQPYYSLEELQDKSFEVIICIDDGGLKIAKSKYTKANIFYHKVDPISNSIEEDQEKLRFYQKSTVELDDFAIEFVHVNISKVM